MFKDEVKQKLNIPDGIVPFTLTLIGRHKAMVSGVKTVLVSNRNLIRLRLGEGVTILCGEDLEIVEIGGGDVYIKGGVNEITFE